VAFERGGLIALATLVLYVWIAPTHIVDGDNAEFATLGLVGGVAHPSGYPLYLIWLQLTSWLPGESPAHTAAIATAILGAAQVLALHAACRAWGARATAASIAVAIFAAGPVVLRIQTEAEVFALNGLAVATVLWLAAAQGPLRGVWRVAVLGLVAGLGLSNHLTCVLLAPVGILGVVRGMRETRVPNVALIGIAVAGLVVGLTPYLYLLATPETPISWGRLEDVTGLVRHFLRSDYGGASQFSPHGTDVAVMTSWAALAMTIGRAWLWLPLGLGLGALGYHLVRPRGPESRWSWALLGAVILVSGPLLASRFNVEPVGVGLYVCQRFHILPALVLAIPVAVGFGHVGAGLQGRSASKALRSNAIGNMFAAVVLIAAVGLSLPHILRMHSPAVELGLKNTLRSLPPNAVVIGTSDLSHFGNGYLQVALGMRPDVTSIAWPQIPSLAYRERLARRSGISIVPTAEGVQSVAVAEQILATGRPLFIDPFGGNIAKAFPSYPYGVLFRVLPKGQAPPPILEVFAINQNLFKGFDLGYRFPGLHDEHATELHFMYARVWQIIAQGLAVDGRREERAISLEFEKALIPREEP
jgi:hypothetical protein